jgi:DNA polymerase III gamma/tau subunit
MEKFLAESYPRPAADTALLARVTEGRIGQATAFDLSIYRQERRTLIELLELIAKGQDRVRLLKAAEYIGKKERDEFEKELDLLTSLLRDIFLLSGGGSQNQIVNIDVVDRLKQLAEKTGLLRVAAWSEKISEVRRNLGVNINRHVAMEAALLGLAEAN